MSALVHLLHLFDDGPSYELAKLCRKEHRRTNRVTVISSRSTMVGSRNLVHRGKDMK